MGSRPKVHRAQRRPEASRDAAPAGGSRRGLCRRLHGSRTGQLAGQAGRPDGEARRQSLEQRAAGDGPQVEQGRPHELGRADQEAPARAARTPAHLPINTPGHRKEKTMHVFFRVTGWLVLALAAAMPAAAQQPAAQAQPQVPLAVSATTAAADPIKDQQKRSVDQPGNNAPVWRDVRSGTPNYTSTQGREAGVLIQQQARFPGQDGMTTAGEAWRKFRNGPVTFYGGWLVVLVCAIIGAIYFAQGPIKLHDKPSGRMIERFSLAERWAHWVMGISFCVLGVSGLIILFGKFVLLPVIGYTLFAWLSALAKNLHNFLAPLFIVSLLVFIVVYIKDNLPEKGDLNWLVNGWKMFKGEHLPSGRFNAGE
ncbi:MAG: hypothetical protein EXR32_04860, partial [Betaproteobacteria bacterium]|nr:hypothetical protein [Betaproteobacteria bacterium]